MKGLRRKCEIFKEENDDLRSTARAATTDQQFHYLTILHGPYTGTPDRGQENSTRTAQFALDLPRAGARESVD
jgi:hypothetical protein